MRLSEAAVARGAIAVFQRFPEEKSHFDFFPPAQLADNPTGFCLKGGVFQAILGLVLLPHAPGKDTAMDYSTLLAALLATPEAAALLPLLEKLLTHLQRGADLLASFRANPITPAATHVFECQLQQLLRDLGRDLCDWTYNHLEADDRQQLPARLDEGGQRYRCRDRSPNTIATLFGTFTLRRYLYEDLEPGNPCLFPLEQQLGIVAGVATPALADQAAWWLAQESQGDTLALLRRYHDVRWSAATLRRVSARVAEGLEQQRLTAQIDKLLRCLATAHQGRGRFRPALVVGRDGIHLPMRGRKPYREGATATVSVYDRRGRRVGTVYLGRMPQPGQTTLSEQLTALLEGVLRRWRGALPCLAYVTDMGSHPKSYFRQVLARLCHPRTGARLAWQRIGDYYHAASYVAKMAEALFGDCGNGRQWLRRMQRRLKEKDGVKRVLQAATYHEQRRGLSGRRRQLFQEGYQYLRRHGKWLRFWEYRKQGLPIGSGVTEAACKTVFTQRLKRSGMRWAVSGGQVVVSLRVVLLSGVWEATVGRWLNSQQVPTPGVKQAAATATQEKAA
jgi:hypothetical protein